MYQILFDTEAPVHYWTVGGDEYLNRGMYKYMEWLKIRPVVCECAYRGRLIEPEYRYDDFTSLLLEKMQAAHLHFAYLQQEKVCMIYGYQKGAPVSLASSHVSFGGMYDEKVSNQR